ncbi:hypothetical protein [Actinobaculum sp. 352]|uniref:hypothetical protein n=1 Tax=Actinobaculum sp. 352 TaxID=2490946 RepID=UPI000F7EDA54|nr:hypothetical protein [Actinobaculum sp. 352]RTE47893.1 hypothetical protein EKN07_11580 [Actinobaculum sp. 352]
MATTFRMRWYGQRAQAAARTATIRGLSLAAEHLKAEAVNQTPIRDGILRGSAATTALDAGMTQVVSFNTPYAVRQHEETGYRHPKGGNAKYLENPLRDEHDTLMRLIAAEEQKALK